MSTINDVRDFWDGHPCQHDLSTETDRKKYFEDISDKRYNGREWHVPEVARFKDFRSMKVLEVGCGIGTDGFEFAKNGADYTGIDLTKNSVAIAKERFQLFGVKGQFAVVNAEEGLPFDDNSFDHIYSFGVIHHSPDTERIVDEMHRVLKPGGTVNVMIYNRSSINYVVEIMFLRKLFRWALYPAFMPKVLAKLTGFDEWKLNGHREVLLARKMTKEEWVSMNTDGPYCPLAKVYSDKEAKALFAKFVDVRQEVWEFNTKHWSHLGRIIPKGFERWLGRRWGWHRMVYATK